MDTGGLGCREERRVTKTDRRDRVEDEEFEYIWMGNLGIFYGIYFYIYSLPQSKLYKIIK